MLAVINNSCFIIAIIRTLAVILVSDFCRKCANISISRIRMVAISASVQQKFLFASNLSSLVTNEAQRKVGL